MYMVTWRLSRGDVMVVTIIIAELAILKFQSLLPFVASAALLIVVGYPVYLLYEDIRDSTE